jgi:hypothetical protein
LLEGKTVNLRIVEKEDLSLLKEGRNNLEFTGQYQTPPLKHIDIDI